MNLISMKEAKAQLRITHSIEDADIYLKLQLASAYVLDYLKLDEDDLPDEWYDDSSPPLVVVPPIEKSLTLLALSELWENRESSNVNVLSTAFKDLARRRRDPAMA
jgi:hypothetical protein